LRGWSPWHDRVDILPRYVSAPSGWSGSTAPSTPPSGPRSRRSPASWDAQETPAAPAQPFATSTRRSLKPGHKLCHSVHLELQGTCMLPKRSWAPSLFHRAPRPQGQRTPTWNDQARPAQRGQLDGAGNAERRVRPAIVGKPGSSVYKG
jgi:hypothetical protein